MLQLYHAVVHPLILYGIIILGSTFPPYLKRLKTLQNRAIKIVARCHYQDGAESFYSQFRVLQIDDLWKYKIAKYVHRIIYNRNSKSFRNYFLKSTEHSNRATQQSTNNAHLSIPRYSTTKLQRCIKYQGVKVWNLIP